MSKYKRIFVGKCRIKYMGEVPSTAKVRPARNGREREYVIEGDYSEKKAIDAFVFEHADDLVG